MRDCYIGLGANLGRRERALREALERLHETPGVELAAVSSFYETAPWGKEDQPSFVNGAAKLRTSLEPLELLEVCRRIEADMGRVRREHWGARTMDIDLLHIPGVVSDSERLRLPHPYLGERAFVLVPLEEIAPGLRIGGKTVKEYRRECPDGGWVEHFPGSPSDFSLKLIACVDRRGGLGRGGDLLFRLEADLAFFREKTLGAAVIMGRRTMESLGRPLEGRRNLVLTHGELLREGFVPCHSLEELWQSLASEDNYVIGGGEVYRSLLPYCREAFITRVEADGAGDVFLPEPEEFLLESCRHERDRATGYGMDFCRYVRRRD